MCLDSDKEILVDFSFESIIWEENPSNNWTLNNEEEISISLNEITAGTSLIIEINFRYELEWDYDYFMIKRVEISF